MALASILVTALWRLRLMSLGLAIGTLAISFEAAAQQTGAPGGVVSASIDSTDSPHPAPASRAATPTTAECVAAHRQGQTLRKQFGLLESRVLLEQCGNAACPAPVMRDCLRWLDEIASQLSSVVFHVEVDAKSARNVKIYVNDELRFQVVPNRAVEFNPGTYRIRFETEGKPAIEKEVVVGEAEKLKNVTVKFAAEQIPSKTEPAAPHEDPKPVTPPSRPATVESRPIPLGSYIFAGLGAAAMINFAAWGFSSKTLVSDLQGRCSPECDPDQVDRARLRATIADISLGVGVASFATATVLYLLRPGMSTPVEVNVSMLPRGGIAGSVRLMAF